MDWLGRLKGRSHSETPTAPVCGRCGSGVITNLERIEGLHRIAKELGGTVDEKKTGVNLPSRLANVKGSLLDAAEQMKTSAERTAARSEELKQKLKENASRCGFRCKECGKVYCMTCLSNYAQPHPVSRGKACFACGGSLAAFDGPTAGS